MEETIRKVNAIFDKMASVKITPASNYSVPEYWMNRAIKGDEKCKDNLFNWISSILNIDKSILNAVFNAKYNKANENKIMNRKLIRLTENDLHKIVKESAKRIMQEVALKGKSGKTYSLHGTDPESWAVMSRVRGKNGYFPNTPQHYHACRDEDNWIELDDKAHPNLRSRNNANRINAMMNRIDDKSKDIMAANESKLSRIVKESMDEFSYSDSEDLGKGRHRQTIIYNGKEIGYLLYIEKNWLAPIEERYILPDIEYGMQPSSGGGLLDGKKGWIDFKVFTNYDEAFRYASQNFEELAYLFEYGDYD